MRNILAVSMLSFVFLGFSMAWQVGFAASAGLVPSPTGSTPSNIEAECKKTNNCGNYQLSDFIQIALLAKNLLFAVLGSITLAFFIYGGFVFLVSGGNSDMVGKAKKIVINAVLGLVVIFISWILVNFVLTSLGYDKTTFSPSGWSTAPESTKTQ